MTTAAIIGQGYVGLPLAEAASEAGIKVIGIDANEGVVDGLNGGRSHIGDIADEQIARMLENGYRATSDYETIQDAETVVICVPTPLGEEGGPDISILKAATRSVAENLGDKTTIILESTTYPGTTEEIVQPILENSGREHGREFYLAFSPERVDPGRQDFGIRNTPKLVGGVTPEATRIATEFYQVFIEEVFPMAGTREAEMAKLLENTYRHVNIALVNEMARFCHDMKIDIWEVIRGASTKPFGFQKFTPGPGVGGHCIPIDPNYLSHHVKKTLGYPFRFVELAQEINSMMPQYVVQRGAEILNENSKALKGSKVLLIGVTYKANISDMRESPAIPLAQALHAKGAMVSYHDPYVETWSEAVPGLSSVPDLRKAAAASDLIVLLQNHDGVELASITNSGVPVLDTRGVVDAPGVEKL